MGDDKLADRNMGIWINTRENALGARTQGRRLEHVLYIVMDNSRILILEVLQLLELYIIKPIKCHYLSK